MEPSSTPRIYKGRVATRSRFCTRVREERARSFAILRGGRGDGAARPPQHRALLRLRAGRGSLAVHHHGASGCSTLTSYLKPGLAYDGAVRRCRSCAGCSARSRNAHRQGIVAPRHQAGQRVPGPQHRWSPHREILDFGIAKVMDSAGGMMSKTRTGMLLAHLVICARSRFAREGVDARPTLVAVSSSTSFDRARGVRRAQPSSQLTMILNRVCADRSGASAPRGVASILQHGVGAGAERRFPSATEMERADDATDHAARASGSPATRRLLRRRTVARAAQGDLPEPDPHAPASPVIAPQPATPKAPANPPSTAR